MTTRRLGPAISETVAYEEGDLSFPRELELFASLIRSGHVWSLQGSYGRMAQRLIDDGLISREGEITEAGHAAIYEWEEE